jgi:hypothetical protein
MGLRRALIYTSSIGALLLLAHPSVGSTPFHTTRSFTLGPGRSVRTFTLREQSGVILLSRLTVPHGAHVVVAARIPHVAGAGVSSWPRWNTPTLVCKRRGASDVCTETQEWCPMPQAVWHVRLVKRSGPAGLVRLDYVVADPPGNS